MKLRPFQEIAVQKMVNFLKNGPEHGCYNATEQGLGKTIEAIQTLNELYIQRILIICPAIMRCTWVAELKKWAPRFITHVIDSKKYTLDLDPLLPWAVIASYQMATVWASQLELAVNFTALILDEAHFCKTPRTQRTKMILGKLWPKIPYRICLSGTPATTSIADLYTTFSKLNPEAFGDWKYFTERYTKPRWDGYSVKYEGIRNEKELSQIIRETFYLRDTKAEVAKDLPPKNWCPIVLPNSYCISHDETDYEKEQHKLYIQQLKGCLAQGKPPPPPPKAVATKRKDQALKLVPAVVEFTKGLLEQGLPVVVFAHHLEVVRQLQMALGYVPTITGETSSIERERNLSNFQNGNCECIIVSMQAGGIGVDLTRASNAVFAEWDYNPATISQSAARVHRLTTKLPVNLYYFTVDRGFDEGIFETCAEKSETFSKVI